MDVEFETLSDEELAKAIAERTQLGVESALQVIRSDDPQLGRGWALSMLRFQDGIARSQEKISLHREGIRRAAG